MWTGLLRTGAVICPVCGRPLSLSGDEKSLLCGGPRTHVFDLGRSGYVNLNSGGGDGDGRESVSARRRFLEAGYYDTLLDTLRSCLDPLPAEGAPVFDAGCGEGYYSRKLAAAFPDRLFFGLDLSKSGVDLAARSARAGGLANADYAVGNLNRIPLADASAGCILNVFAPCFETQFMRVLRPSGRLILVAAGPDHLMGLKERLYESTYPNGEREDLPGCLRLLEKTSVRTEITVEGGHVMDLFSMTPYYWRTPLSGWERLVGLESLTTVIDFEIRIYGKD